MKKGTDYYIEKAVRITSNLSDFDGDVTAWKLAFYELWRYQMTYSFAFDIMVTESKKNGVFVSLLVKPEYSGHLCETMDGLGYRNSQVTEELVAEFDGERMDEADAESVWYGRMI